MNSLSAAMPIGDGEDLLARYDTYFYAQTANTPGLIKTALAIRYQVYCLERKFEDRQQHVDHLESDAFDRKAIHSLIFHRPTAEAIGTARLILPGAEAEALPVQQLLRANNLVAGHYFPAAKTAEVSRFAISNEFRRRRSDGQPAFSPDQKLRLVESERRSNLPCLGLIQALLRRSVARGITHWAAVMEPKLLRMLAGMGVHFTPVGPLVSHHGWRQPSYCDLSHMLQTLRRERPQFWNVVTNAGELNAGELAEGGVVHRQAA
jgi:N-acyl amino acid synthase of PEP-CTERM/exosortase system